MTTLQDIFDKREEIKEIAACFGFSNVRIQIAFAFSQVELTLIVKRDEALTQKTGKQLVDMIGFKIMDIAKCEAFVVLEDNIPKWSSDLLEQCAPIDDEVALKELFEADKLTEISLDPIDEGKMSKGNLAQAIELVDEIIATSKKNGVLEIIDGRLKALHDKSLPEHKTASKNAQKMHEKKHETKEKKMTGPAFFGKQKRKTQESPSHIDDAHLKKNQRTH